MATEQKSKTWVSLVLSDELRAEVERLAKLNGRTRSEEIRTAIRLYLKVSA